MSSAASATRNGEQRRGEVAELRALLKDAVLERDAQLKRRVLRRVLALMSSGVDTAVLFPGMLLALHTSDLVNKKLIYLYLTAHSRTNATLAMLCINTLVKECGDTSPLVRGLALRSLAALRVPTVHEYLLPLLDKALTDSAAYVRRMAVLCVDRVHARAPEACVQRGYLTLLADTLLLRDVDAQVCLDALHVLLSIAARRRRRRRQCQQQQQQQQQTQQSSDTEDDAATASSDDFVVTRDVVVSLLRRLPTMRAWQQTAVITLLARHYRPASEAEMYALMNVLEERLVTHDSGLLLACCNAFVRLTQNDAALQRQALERLRQPLLSMMATCDHVEEAYVLLCHIRLLVYREPALFAAHYRDFYCRYSEPTYVKCAKLDVLARVATAATAPDILRELAALASEERDAAAATWAVRSIGVLAQRLPAVMAMAVQHCLIDLLSLGVAVVRDAVLVVARDFLRSCCSNTDNTASNNNNRSSSTASSAAAGGVRIGVERVQPLLDAIAATAATYVEDSCSEPSRLALLWVLGVYGEYMADAPYLLEAMCTPQGLRTESAAVCAQALHSAMLLFAKRPPEVRHLLGSILHTLRARNSKSKRRRCLHKNADDVSSGSSSSAAAGAATTTASSSSTSSSTRTAATSASADDGCADADVADKARLYYRLLRVSPEEAIRVIAATTVTRQQQQQATTMTFAEDDDVDVVDALMDEFDTWSVVYGVPRRLRCAVRRTTAAATTRQRHGRHRDATRSGSDDDDEEDDDDEDEDGDDDDDEDGSDAVDASCATAADDDGDGVSGSGRGGAATMVAGAHGYADADLMRAWCDGSDDTQQQQRNDDDKSGSAGGYDVSRIWPAAASHADGMTYSHNDSNNNTPADAAAAAAAARASAWLAEAAELPPDAFEQLWRELPDTQTTTLMVRSAAVATATRSEQGAEQVADHLQRYRLYVLAWGAQEDGSTKLYLYARSSSSSRAADDDAAYLLVEVRMLPPPAAASSSATMHDAVVHATVRYRRDNNGGGSGDDNVVEHLADTLRIVLDAFA